MRQRARFEKVALVCGPRPAQATGLAMVERSLVAALRDTPSEFDIEARVVGGRSGRRYAAWLGGRWFPARPGRSPRRVWGSTDLVHLLGLDVPPPISGRFIVNVYDVASHRYPDESAFPPWTNEIVQRADRFVTTTKASADDLEQYLGVPAGKIRIIPLGPGQDVNFVRAPMTRHELAELGLQAPFILRLGGYTARKNVAVLLDAWPEVHRQTGAQLALVGPPQPARGRLLAEARSLRGVVVLDYLPEDTVARLLRSATALVSPSLYEGFGLPPLEAMASGTPVVAIRTGAIEEVCGEAAKLVANHPDALAAGLLAVLNDPGYRERLIVDGRRRSELFTWQAAAASVLGIYRELNPAA